MDKEQIAKICHSINRAYCQSLGDISQPAWDNAPEWQKKSAIAGVEMHLANPDATPEQSHESWLAEKEADGWVYGDVKDAEAKTHPCVLPYADLPAEQKAKDYLFREVVHSLKGFLGTDKPERHEQPKFIPAPINNESLNNLPDQVPVQYIGRKPEFKDRHYGTKLVFSPGQMRVLPKETAKQFLKHPDMFRVQPKDDKAAKKTGKPAAESSKDDDTDELLQKAKDENNTKQEHEVNIMDLKDQINQMDSHESLQEIATRYHEHKLDKRKSIPNQRAEVIGLIDRFGVV